MLLPLECVYVYHRENDGFIAYCMDETGYEYFTASYTYILPLIGVFEKYYPLIYKLSDIMIRDLGGLKGTHAWKNRVIARLKKFLRVMREIGGDYRLHFLSLYTLFEEKLGELEEIIRAIETVKNEYHRVRDPVHELFYPYIRRILEDLQRIRIKYKVVDDYMRKLCYEIEISRDGVRVRESFDDKKHGRGYWETVPLDRLREIIEKRIERREKREKEQRLWHEYWRFLDGELFWDPMDDILLTLNDFLKVI